MRCLSRASYNKSVTSHAITLLICIDLAIRVRWLLTLTHTMRPGKKREKQEKYGKEFKEIEEGLIDAFDLASRSLEVQGEGNSILAVQILRHWIDSLRNREEGIDGLYNACDTMVKWGTDKGDPFGERKGEPKKEVDFKTEITIEGIGGKKLTLFSIHQEVQANFKDNSGNPYITRVGESTR